MNVRDPSFFDLSRLTPEELLAAMEEVCPLLEAANRRAGPLFTLQMAEAELDEAGVIDLDAGDELDLEPEGDHLIVRNAP